MEDKSFSWDEDWFSESGEIDTFLEPDASEVDSEKDTDEGEEAEEEIDTETENKESESIQGEEDESEEEDDSKEDSEEESEETTEEDSEKEEEDSVIVESDAYNEMINGLKLQGFLPNDIDADNLDNVFQHLEESVVEGVEQGVASVMEDLKSNLGEEGVQMLQYLKNGGDFNTFISEYSKHNLEAFDINSESGQEQFLRYYFSKIEKQTPEEVEDRIEYLINSDKLESNSTRYYSKLKEQRKQERERLLTERDARNKQLKEAEKARKTALRQGILSVDEQSDFKFGAAEKREIYDFLTNPTEEINGRYVPKFVAEITRYQSEDPGKLALIVKLMKNGFDFSEIKTKAKTSVTRKIKRKLQAETDTTKPKSTTNQVGKAAWEYFD